MKTTFAIESHDAPAPGIIPEPARVHGPPAAPAGRAARRAAGRTNNPAPRNPIRLSILLAKVLSVIHGDNYMVGAYPAEGMRARFVLLEVSRSGRVPRRGAPPRTEGAKTGNSVSDTAVASDRYVCRS